MQPQNAPERKSSLRDSIKVEDASKLIRQESECSGASKLANSARKIENQRTTELPLEENQLITEEKPLNVQSFHEEDGFKDIPPVETSSNSKEPDYTTRKELEDLIASYTIKDDWKLAFTCVLGLSLQDFYAKFFGDNAQYGTDVFFDEKGEKKIDL